LTKTLKENIAVIEGLLGNCLSNKLTINPQNKMKTKITSILCTLFLSQAVQAVIVPGTSDPWLAGMPNGSTASSGDVAPNQSPVLWAGGVTPGVFYSVSASGAVGNDPSFPLSGPDGDASTITPHLAGAENGIASVTVPLNCLIGLFLGAGQPNLNPAPAALDFTTSASRDYLTLSPALQQPFFIGNGLTSLNAIQQIVAPAGATRLYLGTMDGDGWYNNPGSFTVTVVPEPNVLAFALIGSLCIWFRRKANSLQH